MHVEISVTDQYVDKVMDRAIDGHICTSLERSGTYIIYHIEKAIQFDAFFHYGKFC